MDNVSEISIKVERLKYLVKGLNTVATYSTEEINGDCINFCEIASELLEQITELTCGQNVKISA